MEGVGGWGGAACADGAGEEVRGEDFHCEECERGVVGGRGRRGWVCGVWYVALEVGFVWC